MERLSEEEVYQLISQYRKGDQGAEKLLIKNFYPLIRSVVRRFSNSSEEIEDLQQVGYLGFIKALQRYDFSRGTTKFSTFAVVWVKGEIRTYLRQGKAWLKTGSFRSKKDINKKSDKEDKYNPYQGSLVQAIAGDTSEEEMAASMEIQMEISERLKVALPGESIEETPSAQNVADEVIQKVWLKEALKKLEPLERKVILFRYFKDKSQEEVGELVGVSQRQVSRIEKKILTQMKEELKE